MPPPFLTRAIDTPVKRTGYVLFLAGISICVLSAILFSIMDFNPYGYSFGVRQLSPDGDGHPIQTIVTWTLGSFIELLEYPSGYRRFFLGGAFLTVAFCVGPSAFENGRQTAAGVAVRVSAGRGLGLGSGASWAAADSAMPRPASTASAIPAANSRMERNASSFPGMT